MVFDTAARIALAPLLIGQALSVRKQAQSLPEAAGPRSGVTGQGPDLVLRIIGDSSAAGVGAATQDQALLGQTVAHLADQFTVHWSLDAITGATTRSTQIRQRQRTAALTDIIIMALGVNDITRLVPPNRWILQQRDLHAQLTDLYAPRHMYLSGVPPLEHFPLLPQPLRWTLGRQARAYDSAMRNHADAWTGITYLPFDLPHDLTLMASDGFHPSPQLYQIWGKEMASRIISDWPHFT